MKKYMLLLFAIFALTAIPEKCLAQDNSSEQNEIISQFSLYANDSRGVEFISQGSIGSVDCTETYLTVKLAIEGVFTAQVMNDYSIICIVGTEMDYFNRGLSIMELVDVYIEIINAD